jgi:hypothetical protein
MILCGMLDLCRLIVALAIDLFRPRAAVEAEILVLRFWAGSAGCFRRPAKRSPSFGLIVRRQII